MVVTIMRSRHQSTVRHRYNSPCSSCATMITLYLPPSQGARFSLSDARERSERKRDLVLRKTHVRRKQYLRRSVIYSLLLKHFNTSTEFAPIISSSSIMCGFVYHYRDIAGNLSNSLLMLITVDTK